MYTTNQNDMKSKQTAVEYLFEETIQLNSDMKYSVISWETYLSKRADLFEQAKQMEKEQIEQAYQRGGIDAQNNSIK